MKPHNQFALFRERRFLPFFMTQFLGAFNDNVFKNALVIVVTYNLFHLATLNTNIVINILHGLFILPFFLFSASSGQLADKYEKSMLIRKVKLLECAIMLIAGLGFYFQNLYLLMGVLFLMGTQSTLFGPIKYAILPQVLDDRELLGGNGLVEMGTFVAILLGTILGGILINLDGGSSIISVLTVTIAVIGFFISRGIPATTPVAPTLKISWNFIRETRQLIKLTQKNKTVLLAVMGISWFWFFGSVIIAQIPNFNKLVLHGGPQIFALLLSFFSIGIAIGSMLCERFSGRKIEIGLVPFGSLGLSAFTIDLYFAANGVPAAPEALYTINTFLQQSTHFRVLTDIAFIGIFGGFYIVPLYAMIQQRSHPEERSRVIAANNIINALFMVVAAGMGAVLLANGISIPELFLVIALMNIAVAFYIYRLIPEFLMRFLVWMLIHTLYRIKDEQLDNIPDDGPGVIVCNHVSFVDALVIAGCCQRPIRFVMDHNIFKVPVLSFIFKTARAIPIAPAKVAPEIKQQAFETIAEALENGELVALFPEGKITYDGEINTFKSGIEHIIERTPVPVIPLALQGFWGSFFSRYKGKAMSRLPRRFWSKVALVAGPVVQPGEATASHLQQLVAKLRGDHR